MQRVNNAASVKTWLKYWQTKILVLYSRIKFASVCGTVLNY